MEYNRFEIRTFLLLDQGLNAKSAQLFTHSGGVISWIHTFH